ncbi:MAG TPA: metallopeptidase family protein [Symbiobacteriaceae bacterium]|jgi:hypothetical protein
MIMSIDSFTDLADFYLARIPGRFLLDPDGEPIPVMVEPNALRHKSDPPGVYIMGEYITDTYLPPRIAIYHGSFVKLLRDEPEEVWEDELWETMLHELRHHIEEMAGVSDLDLEDLLDLQQMWQEEEARQQRRKRR